MLAPVTAGGDDRGRGPSPPLHHPRAQPSHPQPLTSEKLPTLGQAVSPAAGTAVLDLACGSGERLCTWARDHGVTGTGAEISTVFLGPRAGRRGGLVASA